MLIAGAFSARIARVNSNGTIDSSFNLTPAPDGVVRDIAIQSDGKIVIGGEFTHAAGLPLGRVARLNPDGTIDSSFATGSGANGGLRLTNSGLSSAIPCSRFIQ